MTLERELQAALRPVDPGPDFTNAVLARVQAPRARRWRAPAALAASLLIALAGLQLVQQQRERARAVAAAEQLQLALAITSAELNEIQQKLSALNNEENGT